MKIRLLKVHGGDLEDSNLDDSTLLYFTNKYKYISYFRICYYNNIFII